MQLIGNLFKYNALLNAFFSRLYQGVLIAYNPMIIVNNSLFLHTKWRLIAILTQPIFKHVPHVPANLENIGGTFSDGSIKKIILHQKKNKNSVQKIH